MRISANVYTFFRACVGLEMPNRRGHAASRARKRRQSAGEEESSCDGGFQALEHGVKRTESEGMVGQVGGLLYASIDNTGSIHRRGHVRTRILA